MNVAMERDSAATRVRALPWEHVATAAVCALAAVLYVWAIGAEGWGNGFYSAAAESMSRSVEAFLFGCYDAHCLVTVDKPPLAFWPQAALVRLFGFHGWAVLLPQAIEGVAAVWLLQRTVRRWMGPGTGVLAALILALTPVTVAIDRDTNPDPLMVLLLVAAAYAVTRSLREESARWLLLGAAFVGLGFSTKMVQAWVVVPALALPFLVYAGGTWGGRVLRLAGAGAVLLATSAWWPVLDAVWPGPKPYVGGSADGTALSLVVGYNGVSRLSGGGAGGIPGGFSQLIGVLLGGIPGPQRLFDQELGGQISWLLPLALLTLASVAVAAWRRRRARRKAGLPAPRLDREARVRRGGWLLWGTWLAVAGAVLSVMLGTFHPYYTTMLAPAIAAVAAAGVGRLWGWYRAADGIAWSVLPAGIALTAIWAAVVAGRDEEWYGWTIAATLVLGAVAVVALVAVHQAGRWAGQRRADVAGAACAAGVAAMLLTPAVWSAGTVLTPDAQLFGGNNPIAGPFMMPSILGLAPPRVRAGAEQVILQLRADGSPLVSDTLSPYQRRVLDYALAHRGRAPIALAVEGGAVYSAAFVLADDRDVVGMGGYEGGDPVPSLAQLDRWTADGDVRYVLSVSPAAARAPVGTSTTNVAAMLGGDAAKQRERWVAAHCRVVSPSAYGGTSSRSMFAGPQTLYDCGGRS